MSERTLVSLLIVAAIATVAGGCATGLNGGQKVMKFREQDGQALTRAPDDGAYVVAFRQVGSGELWKARGTRRELKRGEELGFTRDDDGRVIAVAGDFERRIGAIPLIAQYACWYRLPDGYDENRQFRKSLRGGAKVAAAAALETGLVVGPLWAEEKLESLTDERRWTKRVERRRQGQ